MKIKTSTLAQFAFLHLKTENNRRNNEMNHKHDK